MNIELLMNVIDSVESCKGRLFIVYGHGGTEKAFHWKTLISRVRCNKRHSTEIDESSSCEIERDSSC